MEISIGLWGQGGVFTKIAENTNLRNAFVRKITTILESEGFHGLHVFWQWPKVEVPTDNTNYILLLEDLSKVNFF